MLRRLIAAALGFLTLVSGGALAQTPASPPHDQQPRSTQSPNAFGAEAPPTDLEATRRRFDQNAARRAEGDRKRDAKLGHSMRSICEGCGGTAAMKPPRAFKRRLSPVGEDAAIPPED